MDMNPGHLILAAILLAMAIAAALLFRRKAIGVDVDVKIYLDNKPIGGTWTYIAPDEATAAEVGTTFLNAAMHENHLTPRIGTDTTTPLEPPTIGWCVTRGVVHQNSNLPATLTVEMHHRIKP